MFWICCDRRLLAINCKIESCLQVKRSKQELQPATTCNRDSALRQNNSNNNNNINDNNIRLLDEAEQNIVIYQWRADQLFADAEGRGK